MKNIYLIIFAIFIFAGCSTSQVKVNKKTNIENNNAPYTMQTANQNDYSSDVAIQDNFEFDDGSYRVAIVFPSKEVGKYAKDAINTMMAYMLHNKIKFSFEVFDSFTQEQNNIINVFNEINNKKFKNVIALFTQESIDDILTVNGISDLNIYLPLINKNEVIKTEQNITYGGIDYKSQIDKLLMLSNKKNTVLYSNNNLGLKLKNYVEISQPLRASTAISEHNNVFKKIVKNRKLQNSSLFLNTSIIKSSIILSQLRAHDTVPYKILSTQLNYTPLVISLTQYHDRKNFTIANSIEETDLKLQESLALFDADIQYNWVNYSTLVGIDYLFAQNDSRIFPSKIINNQVNYNVELLKSTRYGFKKLNTN